MKLRGVLVVAVLGVGTLGVAACTKPNPLSCADGLCSDPAFPFCDVNGEVEGSAGTCIAVACTPADFAGCRGDFAITCNATGDNFDLVECARGCEEGTGCRLCDPSETACTNGTVATCDASGAVVSSQACALGCFEDEPRCRDIDPSNNLGQFLDMSASADNLDLVDATINTTNGELRDSATNALLAPRLSVLLPAPEGGAPIRVFVSNRAHLANVQVFGQPALAIIANGEIEIEGVLSLYQDPMLTPDPVSVTPGGVHLASCRGGTGGTRNVSSGTLTQNLRSASGGGGHATAGGKGGDIGAVGGQDRFEPGGAGGGVSGSPTLVPLRGGCDSGIDGVGGGGAIQLVSRQRVALLDGARIDANGQLGTSDFFAQNHVGVPLLGGGAGGGILIEAPSVEIGVDARLLVNGGPAATESVFAPPLSLTTAASPGGTCTSSGTLFCGNGGRGAGLDAQATAGADVPYQTLTITNFVAAGGGGGLGYIRINTAAGQHTKSSTAIESGITTEALVKTR